MSNGQSPTACYLYPQILSPFFPLTLEMMADRDARKDTDRQELAEVAEELVAFCKRERCYMTKSRRNNAEK